MLRSKVLAAALTLACSQVALGRLSLYTENFNTNTNGAWPWQGMNNLTGGQNYRWQNTNFTGSIVNPPGGTATGAGELGGIFTRANSPPVSFYGFNTGPLNTATDSLEAHGVIRLRSRGSSSGYVLGFFNSTVSFADSSDPDNFLGFYFDDGHDTYTVPNGTNIADDGQVDPGGGGGVTVPFSILWNHTTQQATYRIGPSIDYFDITSFSNPFTHFGVAPVNDNGGPLEVYFDDFTFTVGVIPPAPPVIWNVNSSGDWGLQSNWSPDTPNAVGVNVLFGSVITSAKTVFSDEAVTAGSIKFDNANTYQIVGNGSLSIDVASGSGSIEVVQGSHKINLPLYLKDNTDLITASGATLTLLDPTELTSGITVNKNGPGTVTVLSTVNAAGPVTVKVNGGVLNLAATNSDPDISVDIDPATVNIGADQTFGNMALSLGGNVVNVGVDPNGAVAPAKLTVNNLTVTGGGDANYLNQTLAGNTVTVNGALSVQANSRLVKQGPGVLKTSTVSIDSTGNLDLTDGRMIVTTTDGSVAASIRSLIISGAIDSSTVAANPGTGLGYARASDIGVSSFGGEAVTGNNVLVRYTWLGDADLNGGVDTIDFNLLAANFSGSGKQWSQGDFNLDGVVDTIDFNLLASTFGSAALPSAASDLGGVVPEPGSTVALIFGTATLASRRRKARWL